MVSRAEVLRDAMARTGTTQTQLARLSGVRQPSISQALSGKVAISDRHLDRLLSCLGFRLEISRRAVEPELTRSEQRSWRLHRAVADRLDDDRWEQWRPVMVANLERLRTTSRGEPHERNLDRWRSMLVADDRSEVRRVLTGLDRDAIEMREVSPMSGLLTEEERARALADTH